MMRKHSRYVAPDRGKRESDRDFVSSSTHFGKQTGPISNIFPRNKRLSKNTGNRPFNHIVILATFICIYLFFIVEPSYQQHNAQLCPKVCTCDEQNLEVSCHGKFVASGLPHTLNPSTKKMSINYAQTTQLTSSDLDNFRSLEVLDLAYNNLTIIDLDHIKSNTYLTSLNVSHNNLTELKDSAISIILNKLPTSDSVYNLSAIIELDEFKKLRKSKINVIVLNISYNRLTVLKSFIFMRWHRLQKLDLSYNNIETLQDESLCGLSKLEHLILKGNHIKQIPSSAMQSTARSLSTIALNEQNTSTLEVIDLSENPLVSVDANSFNSLSHVQELYLDSCLIKTIDSQAFNAVPSITILSLTNNDLIEVPSQALSPLMTLKILKMPSNNIHTLRPYAFKNLFNLEELYLNNGSLSEFEVNALYGLESLKLLQLDYNPNLTSIKSNIFDDLPSLTHLSIRMGSLTTLIANANIDKHSLVVVDLRGNSLKCNCDLKWLTESLKKLNETAISIQNKTEDYHLDNALKHIILDPIILGEILNVTCAWPAALVGKQIISLPNNKLECLEPSSSLNVHIGFASLFFMVFILTTACLVNFCRNEKHLIGLLKENIVQNRMAMILPYSHEAQNTDDFSKETQIECAEYEPIDYGQYYGPIYTLPLDHCMNGSVDLRYSQL